VGLAGVGRAKHRGQLPDAGHLVDAHWSGTLQG
jgi:hypothetical protein